MAAPSQRAYDVMLDTYGFRLAPAQAVGGRNHLIEPIPFLSQQISSTAELTYTDISRDVEVAFAQDDWSGGIADTDRFNIENSRRFRYSKNIDTSYPRRAYPGPLVTTIGATITNKPTVAVQRGSITYIAAGADLYQITNSTTRTLDTTFGASITSLLVWGGYLIVGLGSATNFRYRASDASGGAFTDAGFTAQFIVAISDILWRKSAASQVSSADATGGPWATYDVGDSSYAITSLGVLDTVLLIGKEDGEYGLDSDGVATPLTPELRLQADAQVGKVAIAFNRDFFFTSRWGMVRIRPGEGLKNVGLDVLADPALPGSPAEPRPTAFTTDGRFLYALVVPSGTAGIYIWKRDFSDAWHNYLYRTDLGNSSDLLFATGKLGSTSVNAIVFAYQSGGNWQLAYANFPRTADPAKDSAYAFDTVFTGTLRTLDYVASYPTIQKYSDRATCIADDLASTRPVSISSRTDNDSTTYLLKDFALSPADEVTLTTPLSFYRLALEIQMRADATAAPKLRAFHLSTALLTRVVRKHTFHLLAMTAVPLATGGRARASSSYKDVIEVLREMRRTQASLSVVDEDQREFTAFLSDIVETTEQERGAQGFAPVKVCTVILKEVTT